MILEKNNNVQTQAGKGASVDITYQFQFWHSEGNFVHIHIQIVGEIKAAREVLVEVTSRLRNYLYREEKDMCTPMSAPSPVGSALGLEPSYSNNTNPSRGTYSGNDLPIASSQNVQNVASQNVQNVATAQPAKLNSNKLFSFNTPVPQKVQQF